ncbi:RdgB/HAM1 family non-canonical purine NTP pyrophosphatase [Taibaiella koreensis]|uniref:RdgB/HAM1 family non-canonical purine NTP pyrophosphatase n=1 Tax=Taibaiella koreensis TaxID=1268548 RepID=UPI000E59D510|nr:RdgB/HAM1 family non-canonical purine NTP pyrophosphatase [Taibaiella koreensis]
MNLIFASNNKGKIIEVQTLISESITVVSLLDAGITEPIEEPFDTFRENAWAKADYVYRKTGLPCFADDSGLVVPALDGAPGVYSARYAGESANDAANNHKLLQAIAGIDRPGAYYQAVICYIDKNGDTHYFDGRCQGYLIHTPRGKGGFGYDPLFVPDGHTGTFAELSQDIKNEISHRGAAMRSFIAFLDQTES